MAEDNDFPDARRDVLDAVRRALAAAPDLAAAAPGVLERLCEGLGWDLGVLSVLEPDGGSMRRVATWRRGGVPALDEARQLSGAAGAAAAGLSGSVAVPIGRDGRVLGLVELYAREYRRPDDELTRTLDAVCDEIATFLGREDAVPAAPNALAPPLAPPLASPLAPGAAEAAGGHYRAVVERIPAVTYVGDLGDGLAMRFVSPQISTLLGFSAGEWTRDPGARLRSIHEADRSRVVEAVRSARERGRPYSLQYRVVIPDGRTVWVRDSATVLRDEAGRPGAAYGFLVEVASEWEAEDRVAFGRLHDELTGLPNLTLFEEVLEQVLARAHRHHVAVAVLAVDLDDFEPLNETVGREAGNQLLRQAAARLRDAAGEAELVARRGGDDFLLLLAGREQTGAAGARESASEALLAAEVEASRIHEAFQAPFTLAGSEFYVTVSIGISVFPVDATDVASMVRHAEGARDRSRKSGPGGFVLYSSEAADPVRGLSFTTRLRNAVERRQWVLHYHPIMDLAERQMVGVEALLRWQDPSGQLVPPGEFILAAEDMGLIEAVGDWVVEEVCRQSRAWRNQGIELDVSINLSPRQLWQPGLVQKVARHLRSSGIDPETVVIEITEAAAAADPERTRGVLRGFAEQGLRLAIDDFGTAQSSIGRLRQLPVDILKVDQSFVRHLPRDRDAARMARAIIALARSLDMMPLAEGIDSEDQRRFLLDQGCQLGQGYLFNRPMPADEITAWCLGEVEAEAEAAPAGPGGYTAPQGPPSPLFALPPALVQPAPAVREATKERPVPQGSIEPEVEADPAEAEIEAEVPETPPSPSRREPGRPLGGWAQAVDPGHEEILEDGPSSSADGEIEIRIELREAESEGAAETASGAPEDAEPDPNAEAQDAVSGDEPSGAEDAAEEGREAEAEAEAGSPPEEAQATGSRLPNLGGIDAGALLRELASGDDPSRERGAEGGPSDEPTSSIASGHRPHPASTGWRSWTRGRGNG